MAVVETVDSAILCEPGGGGAVATVVPLLVTDAPSAMFGAPRVLGPWKGTHAAVLPADNAVISAGPSARS